MTKFLLEQDAQNDSLYFSLVRKGENRFIFLQAREPLGRTWNILRINEEGDCSLCGSLPRDRGLAVTFDGHIVKENLPRPPNLNVTPAARYSGNFLINGEVVDLTVFDLEKCEGEIRLTATLALGRGTWTICTITKEGKIRFHAAVSPLLGLKLDSSGTVIAN